MCCAIVDQPVLQVLWMGSDPPASIVYGPRCSFMLIHLRTGETFEGQVSSYRLVGFLWSQTAVATIQFGAKEHLNQCGDAVHATRTQTSCSESYL